MIDHEEIEPTEPDSITADLAAAWDASEDDNGAEAENAVSEPEIQREEVEGQGQGQAAEEGNEEGIRQDQEPENPVSENTESNEKPPVGLSLEAREAWKDTPDAVKADIAKREKDYASGIEKHRINTERVRGMDESLRPFGQLFAMNGGGPSATLMPLLQTASLLQLGSPQQKAEAAANIIRQFGVDIQTLDNMLVGQAPSPEVQQQSQMEQMFNERLGPLQQQLGVYKQREQQAQQQYTAQVGQQINDFGASHEFYSDVQSDMADLLEMAANRGRQMSMDEAYNTACAAHPQIAKIISGRQSQQTVQSKRNAASSIHGTSGGSMAASAPNSVAAALNDAWDSAGRM